MYNNSDLVVEENTGACVPFSPKIGGDRNKDGRV